MKENTKSDYIKEIVSSGQSIDLAYSKSTAILKLNRVIVSIMLSSTILLFTEKAVAQIPPDGTITELNPQPIVNLGFLQSTTIPAYTDKVPIGIVTALYGAQDFSNPVDTFYLEISAPNSPPITIDILNYSVDSKNNCSVDTFQIANYRCDIEYPLSVTDRSQPSVKLFARFYAQGHNMNGDPYTVYRTRDFCTMRIASQFCRTECDPMMPTGTNATSWSFDIPATSICPSGLWIDPPVAGGYEYAITGSDIEGIQLPSYSSVPDTDGYTVIHTDNSGQQITQLDPGEPFDFPSPVSSFTVNGINPQLSLDPADVMAFPLAVKISPTGVPSQITQTPITVSDTPPQVSPTTNVAIGYAPFVAQLNAGGQDPNGGTLTYDWTETNSGLVVQDVAIPNVTLSSPGDYNFEVIASGNGTSSAIGSVGVKALEKECWLIDEAAMLNQLKVRAHSANGNYSISGHKTNIQNALSSALTDFRTLNPNVQETYYLIGIKDLTANASVTGIENITARYNGTDLTLFEGSAPTTAFWDGENLVTGDWYKISLTFQSLGARLQQGCTGRSIEFRLPEHTASNGFNLRRTRPMEISDPKNGTIRTVNVPITAKAIILPVGGLGPIETVPGRFGTVTPFVTDDVRPPVVTTTPETVLTSPVIIVNPGRVVAPVKTPVQKKQPVIETQKVKERGRKAIPEK